MCPPDDTSAQSILPDPGSSQQTPPPAPRRNFFPLPDDFCDYLQVPLEKFEGPRKVLVSLDVLRSLIGLAAAAGFDEKFYLDRHADLRKAWEAGQIADLRTHFVTQGYFEKRAGCRDHAAIVDEAWYLKENPDVAEGLKKGHTDSATAHYQTTGRKEGRLPAGGISEELRLLVARLHPAAE